MSDPLDLDADRPFPSGRSIAVETMIWWMVAAVVIIAVAAILYFEVFHLTHVWGPIPAPEPGSALP